MLISALVAIVLILLVLWYLSIKCSARYCWSIPSIKPGYPVLGHIPLFWQKTSKQAFWTFMKCFAQVDRLSKMMLGPKPVILVNHPDLLQHVLNRGDLYSKPFFYDFFGLGSGLVSERDGEKWLTTRKALNPAFNTRMLTYFLPIMDHRAKKLVAKLRPLAGTGRIFDIHNYFGECTLEMVFSTTMGRRANELPGQRDYVRHLESILNRLGERILNVNQYIGIFYQLSKTYKIDQISRKFCNEFTDKIIRERRQELESEKSSTTEKDEFERKSMNFLDQILTTCKEDGTVFGDLETAQNLYTVMVGGNDSTALTLSYSCLFLAFHPEIQSKVAAEMAEVFPTDDIEITLQNLKQLRYTERFLKEVLRLCPSVAIASRETSNDKLVLDGIRIPSGQILTFNFFALHRRTDFWGEDPERFDPDRFLPEAVEARHHYAYLPFSGGLRNCIGARYAMNAMTIVLLRVLREFEIKTTLRREDLRFKFEISMKLDGPHSVWLEKRVK